MSCRTRHFIDDGNNDDRNFLNWINMDFFGDFWYEVVVLLNLVNFIDYTKYITVEMVNGCGNSSDAERGSS